MMSFQILRKILDAIILVWIVVFVSDRFTPWFSNFNACQLLSKYTSEEIDHFAKFALSEGKLKKWRKDIRIKVCQYDGREDLNVLMNKGVDLVNLLLEEIEIIKDTAYYNLEVVFHDSTVLNRLGYAPTKESVFRIPYPTIKSGRMEVYSGDPDVLNSIIYHEFSHILGFHHNFLVDYQSVFNSTPKKLVVAEEGEKMVPSFENYSELDKAAIRIMYDKDVGIDPGLTKRKFFRMIKKAKREMGYEDPVVGGG